MSVWIQFEAYGEPKPQGSKVAGVTSEGKPYVRDSNPKGLAEWRRVVADAAGRVAAARGGPLITGPVALWTVFFLPAPKSRPRWKRLVDTKIDGDKAKRAVMDALTGKLFRDDAQVVWGCFLKVYAVDCSPKAVVSLLDLTAVEKDEPSVHRALIERGSQRVLRLAFG